MLRPQTALLVALTLAAPLLAAEPKYGPDDRPWATPLWKEHEYLRSPRGAKSDFWLLVGYYFAQPNDYSCSAGALAPVLNAALTSLPQTTDSDVLKPEGLIAKVDVENWKARTSAEGFKKPGVEKVIRGVDLQTMPKIVEAAFKQFGLVTIQVRSVQVDDAGPKSLERLRQDLEASEGNARNFILGDFDRGKLSGDPEAGHWAAIAAFDAKKDRVLVLDPERDDYEPYWVDLAAFAGAMATQDKSVQQNRGYLIVSF